jgi:hypothetical protein
LQQLQQQLNSSHQQQLLPLASLPQLNGSTPHKPAAMRQPMVLHLLRSNHIMKRLLGSWVLSWARVPWQQRSWHVHMSHSTTAMVCCCHLQHG